MNGNVEDRVLRWLRQLGDDRVLIEADTDLTRVDELDSLVFTEVLTWIQQEFGLYVPDAELTCESMGTPRRIARTIERFRGEGAP